MSKSDEKSLKRILPPECELETADVRPAKVARPVDQLPSHALGCNQEALRGYKELDEKGWQAFYIDCIQALKTENDHKKLRLNRRVVTLPHPKLNGILRTCKGLRLPAEFIPPDEITYVDMAPLIQETAADSVMQDALEKYCQEVDFQLRELDRQIYEFRELWLEARATLRVEDDEFTHSDTFSWRMWQNDKDPGIFSFYFAPTSDGQRDAVAFLRGLMLQEPFKDSKPSVATRY